MCVIILSNEFKEQKIKCEQQNIKNDIIFNEIKEQNIPVSYTHLNNLFLI